MLDTEVQAGRELDALVAEKVMGYQVTYQWVIEGSSRSGQYESKEVAQAAYEKLASRYVMGELEVGDDVEPYSTDIAAAWEVVEKLRDKYQWELHVSDIWVAVVYDGGIRMLAHDEAETMPLAICRAALRAVGAP